ncbi:MAG TPA: nucleotidyltransferase [Candidatus Mediterraneibacter pullistercoris]|nr:nucleotidyltransferase [Candidatus Mediterraneibacter pullistercoris]
MSRAALVIMAAGIGSRFGGGIKQLAPVGPNGEIIMDYSIYDAIRAGFDKVVFVIRKDLEKEFRETIGDRIARQIDVSYVYQEISGIPEIYKAKFPERTRPWGTGQAILCCRDVVDSPFLVINADDYYGRNSYREAYSYLTSVPDTGKIQICMVSFVLKNTLSDNGGVTRGVCRVDESGMLTDITETRNIEKSGDRAVIREGAAEKILDPDSPVSMNMWGLTPAFFDILGSGFETFLKETSEEDLKAEYLLPTIIGELLNKGKVSVKVLRSEDQWFGVTYKEDREAVTNAVRELIQKGMYPPELYT